MHDADQRDRRGRVLLLTVYAALALFILTEKWGRATSDTRFELTENPVGHLAGTFELWNPMVSLGELQNQAYGYLFPHGSFFALLDVLGMPGWLSQRFWSILVLIVACEGVRRLAAVVGMRPWGAAIAGLAYGLTPRHVTEIGTRSAEVLPGAVLPWALLPIVLAIQGRLRPRHAAVLSAAAFACSGGVNGTATAAPAALLAIVVVWAVATRRLSWRFGLGWLGLIGAVCAWWALSLLRLGAYSPPFFDYVEDARATTSSSGPSAVLRGASNWVGYVNVGGERWWPAGYDLGFDPWLVLGTGVVAILGLLGLLRFRGALRAPLVLAALFGLTCQVIAHTGTLDGPFSQVLRDLLDGPLAPLRNVTKVDPVLRVPIALGLGVLVDDIVRHLRHRSLSGSSRIRERARRTGAAGLALALAGGLVAMAQPVATADTRTPGWEKVPDHWTDAARYLEERADAIRKDGRGGGGATWVVPGSGFGIQRWGWTMEETMGAVARTPWITRSQVPLTPAATIRMFSEMEAFLETGSGSPYLRHLLNRVGIDTVLVRHDLDTSAAQTTPGSLVAVALGRSPGITREASFGALEFGPAIEIYGVEPAPGAEVGTGGYDIRDVDDAVTVAGSVEAAVAGVGSGLVGPAQAIVLAGTPGWKGQPVLVGDGYRLRERAFGRLHDAESNVLAPDEGYHADRVVPNYPGVAGARPVVARYDGIAGLDASSSRAWADTLGAVHPENAPWSALDGDPSTYWRPAPFLDVQGQWLEVDLPTVRRIGTVELAEPVAELDLDRVQRWRITAGDTTREVTTDPATGRATAHLGVRADRVRVEVLRAPSTQAAVGLAEVTIDGVEPSRTLVLPEAETDGPPDLVFSAAPEARACVTTLLGPDCDAHRSRAAEEATGIDRTFTLTSSGTWDARGVVVARSRPGTLDLIQPLSGVRMDGSSWLAQDPSVSVRMAYDDDPATSWVADPRDREPTLTIDLGRTRTLTRLSVAPPAGIAVRPDRAVIRAETASGEVVREADLNGFGGFAPVQARRITITFSRQAAAVGGTPLGIGEVTLAGAPVAVPLDGGGPTGAVCGLGPPLVVDGEVVETRVEGFVGDVVAAGQLAVVPCADEAQIRLDAGEHRVQLLSTEQFQPVGLTLDAVGAGADAERAPERSRDIRLLSSSETRVRLDVGPGEEAVLSAPHNVNAGWVAEIDGHELEPLLVDGWAQGWVVPEDLAGEVELVYAPQRSYLVVLITGLALLAGVLLWGLVLLVSGRWRRSARSIAGPEARPARRQHRSPGRLALTGAVGAVGLAALVGWLIGGPVAAGAAALGVLLGRWPRLVQGLVGGLLLGALVALAVTLTDGPRLPPRAVDLVTAAALALGLAAALVRRPPSVRTPDP